MMAHGDANIIEFDDTTGGGTRNSGVLLKQTTSAFSAPFTSGATTHSASWELTQTRIVLAWREIFRPMEQGRQGRFRMVCWIPTTPARVPLSSVAVHWHLHGCIQRSRLGNHSEPAVTASMLSIQLNC